MAVPLLKKNSLVVSSLFIGQIFQTNNNISVWIQRRILCIGVFRVVFSLDPILLDHSQCRKTVKHRR